LTKRVIFLTAAFRLCAGYRLHNDAAVIKFLFCLNTFKLQVFLIQHGDAD